MADVRVRLPLGALAFGVWESLAIPPVSGTGDRWFKSNCADFNCGGARVGTGRRLLSAPAQVRFLSPQLVMEGQAGPIGIHASRCPAMAAVSKTVESFDVDATLNVTHANRPWMRCAKRDAEKSLEGSTPSPSAMRALGRAAEVPAFQAGEAGSTPAGHFENANTIPGSSLLVVMPDSGTDAQRWSHESVGSIPTAGTK